MNKFRHIYLDIYKVNVWFIYCSADYYQRKMKTEIDFCADVTEFHVGQVVTADLDAGRTFIVWVRDWDSLTHELFHCVFAILDYKGMCLTKESQEAYAYLMEYLDREIRKFE